MSNLENTQRRLAVGTTSWLNFEFNCDRGDLLSEKSLAVPVGQILRGIYTEEERVKAEVNHPFLKRIVGARGRKAQLDFAIFRKTAGPEKVEWVVGVETKWVGNSSVTFDQVLWDLVRLEFLLKNVNAVQATSCVAFFVIAGF